MDWEALVAQHGANLEDFWGRRVNGPRFVRHFTLFGRPVQLSSNCEKLLTAVDYALPLYSTAPASNHSPLSLHFVVRDFPLDPGPLPQDLFAVIQYSGYDEWLSMHIGGWGHCHIDLAAGQVIAVLAPQLGKQPDLVSRYLLLTIFNNLLTGQGFSMLHCTGLLRDDRVLLLMAPHNSGKSTTALRLMLAGYTLISDSQIYIAPDSENLELLGFPVGKAKLRRDMLPEFPQLHPFLTTELVRNETKYSLDLRQLNPALICATAVRPVAVDLCLLARHESPDTRIKPATRTEVMSAIIENSIYYDTATAWRRNLTPIERLVKGVQGHHLIIGTAAEGIVAAVNNLIGE